MKDIEKWTEASQAGIKEAMLNAALANETLEIDQHYAATAALVSIAQSLSIMMNQMVRFFYDIEETKGGEGVERDGAVQAS